MFTETQEIADLFQNPRKVQRTQPFRRVVSKTFGKGTIPAQAGGPGETDPGPPPGPKVKLPPWADPDWTPQFGSSTGWGR